MALNINGNLGINTSNNVFASKNPDIVVGDELTKVAAALLSGTPKVSTKAGNPLSRVNTLANANQETKLADVNLAKQSATNRIGLNINLSQNTLNAINGLNAKAAQLQAMNLSKVVDGKIHINSEKTDFTELKPLTSLQGKDVEVFNSGNLGKDRRGPGGFYMPLTKDEEETKEEGFNVVI